MITEPAQAELQQMRAQAHSNCVVCSPSNRRSLCLKYAVSDDGSVQACFDCDESFEGYAGMLHGGVIASLLDGAMTNCMFAHGIPAMTAELAVRFRHPVVIHQSATVRAWIERSSPPLHLLKAEIRQDEHAKATASGKFMERAELMMGIRRFRRTAGRSTV